MTADRLTDYLDHILEAIDLATGYVDGMRNRITHGYFDVDLDIVWNTIKLALPDLKKRILDVKQSI